MLGDAHWPRKWLTNAWKGASKSVAQWPWMGWQVKGPAPSPAFRSMDATMVDFVKIRLRGQRHRHYRRALRDHPALLWTDELHLAPHPPQGCTVVAPGTCGWWFYANGSEVLEMRGSFHKLCQGDNWQDFTHANYKRTVGAFCDTYGLFKGALHLLNVELGVNVEPPVPTEEMLSRVLFHRTTRPIPMKPPAKGIVVMREGNYRLKVYDKAAQYGMPFDLMRFEVHVDRMGMLHNLGIHTAADLCDPEVWERAQQFILSKFDELFIIDTDVNTEAVTSPQAVLLEQAKEWSFWKGLNPNKRNRKRAKVQRLYEAHSRPYLRGILRGRMEGKLNALRAAE